MTDGQYLPHGDPNEAVYFDLDARLITLACGKQVPILRYMDTDGDEVEQQDLDLHDHLAVVCGPTSNGLLIICTISIEPNGATGTPYPAEGTPNADAPVYRSH